MLEGHKTCPKDDAYAAVELPEKLALTMEEAMEEAAEATAEESEEA